jgi:hypothetical protein
MGVGPTAESFAFFRKMASDEGGLYEVEAGRVLR